MMTVLRTFFACAAYLVFNPASAELVQYTAIKTDLSLSSTSLAGVGAGGQIYGSVVDASTRQSSGFIYSFSAGSVDLGEYIPVSVDRAGNAVGYVGSNSGSATQYFYRASDGTVSVRSLAVQGASVALTGDGVIHQSWSSYTPQSSGYEYLSYASLTNPNTGVSSTFSAGYIYGYQTAQAVMGTGQIVTSSSNSPTSNPQFALVGPGSWAALSSGYSSAGVDVFSGGGNVYSVVNYGAFIDPYVGDISTGDFKPVLSEYYLASKIGRENIGPFGSSVVGVDSAGRVLTYTSVGQGFDVGGYVIADSERLLNNSCEEYSCYASLYNLITDRSMIDVAYGFNALEMGLDGTVLTAGVDGFVYALVPVPEAHQWLMLLVGGGLVVPIARRRRSYTNQIG